MADDKTKPAYISNITLSDPTTSATNKAVYVMHYTRCTYNITFNTSISNTAYIKYFNISIHTMVVDTTNDIGYKWEQIDQSHYVNKIIENGSNVTITFDIPPEAYANNIDILGIDNKSKSFKFKFVIEYKDKNNRHYILDTSISDATNKEFAFKPQESDSAKYNYALYVSDLYLQERTDYSLLVNMNIVNSNNDINIPSLKYNENENVTITSNDSVYNFINTSSNKDIHVVFDASYADGTGNTLYEFDPAKYGYIKSTWNYYIPFGYDNNKYESEDNIPIYYTTLPAKHNRIDLYGKFLSKNSNNEVESDFVKLELNNHGQIVYNEYVKLSKAELDEYAFNTLLYDCDEYKLYGNGDRVHQLRVIDEYKIIEHIYLDVFNELTSTDTGQVRNIYYQTGEFDENNKPIYLPLEKDPLTKDWKTQLGNVAIISGGKRYTTVYNNFDNGYDRNKIKAPYSKEAAYRKYTLFNIDSKLAHPYMLFNAEFTDNVDSTVQHTYKTNKFKIYTKQSPVINLTQIDTAWTSLVNTEEQPVDNIEYLENSKFSLGIWYDNIDDFKLSYSINALMQIKNANESSWTNLDIKIDNGERYSIKDNSLVQNSENTELPPMVDEDFDDEYFDDDDEEDDDIEEDNQTEDQSDYNAIFTVSKVSLADELDYRFEITYYNTKFYSNVLPIDVKESAQIIQDISSDVDLNDKSDNEEIIALELSTNTSIIFDIIATGDDLEYQWQIGSRSNDITSSGNYTWTWNNINSSDAKNSNFKLDILDTSIRGSYYRCVVRNAGREQNTWQYTKIIFIREIKSEYENISIDKNIAVVKLGINDLNSGETVDIESTNNYMIYSYAYNDDPYINKMDVPTILTRDDFTELNNWVDYTNMYPAGYTPFNKSEGYSPIISLYSFPTDFDIDKVTNNFAVASDISKQRVYVYNVAHTDRTDRLALPVAIINAPDINNNKKFGYRVYINNNIICVSDPYATVNKIENVGAVYVYKFNPVNNGITSEITLTPTKGLEQSHLSFGENIEFDSRGNIIITATEETYTNIIYYLEGANDTITPVKNKSKDTKELELTTTGVVYIFNGENYNFITKLNSHRVLGEINYEAKTFGTTKPERRGMYTLKYYDTLTNVTKIHNFSELPDNNTGGSKLALFNNWFDLIYSYDYSFRQIAYCKYMNVTLYNGNNYTIYFGFIDETTGQINNESYTEQLPTNSEFIAVGGIKIGSEQIRFRKYYSYDTVDFDTGNNHGNTYFTLSKSNSYYFNSYCGYFGSAISYSDTDTGGILAVSGPYYNEGFVDIFKFNKYTNHYVYSTTITPPTTYDYKIINFGKTVEVSNNAVIITFDKKINDGSIISGVYMYTINDDGNIDTIKYNDVTEPGTTDFGTAIDSYGSNIVISAPKNNKIFRYSFNKTSVGDNSDLELTYLQALESEALSSGSNFGRRLVINKNHCLVGYDSYTLMLNNSIIPCNGAILQYTDVSGKYTLL